MAPRDVSKQLALRGVGSLGCVLTPTDSNHILPLILTPFSLNQQNGDPKEEALRKLFVGGLSRDTSDDQFKDYFNTFGEVVDHIVIKDNSGFSKYEIYSTSYFICT